MRAVPRALATAVLAAAGPLAARTAAAQDAAPPVGARVRLETRGSGRVEGVVVALDGDTLRLGRGGRARPTSAARAVPVADVRAYTVAAGRARWRGAGRGALVGGALGLVLVGAALYVDAAGGDVIIPATFTAVPAALALTGVGASVGALFAPRRWSAPVPLRVGARRSPSPTALVSLAVSF